MGTFMYVLFKVEHGGTSSTLVCMWCFLVSVLPLPLPLVLLTSPLWCP